MRSDRERRGFTTESLLRRDVVKRTAVLPPAEQERRAKERSRQAALKIAAKRSEERERRVVTARRKSHPETFALQTGHDNTAKVRGQRAVAGPKPGEHEGASMSTGYDPRKTPSLSLSRGRSMVMPTGHITDSYGARRGPAALQALQSGGCISRREETIAFIARQRRKASLQKRDEEDKKRWNAEKLRLALEKLDQDCKRSVSQRQLPLRSRKAAHALKDEKDATVGVRDSTSGGIPKGRRKRLERVSPAPRGSDMPPAGVSNSGVTRDGRSCDRGTERTSFPRSQPKSMTTDRSARKHAKPGGSEAVGDNSLACESFQRLQTLHRKTRHGESRIDGKCGSTGRDNGDTEMHGSQASLRPDEGGNEDGAPEVREGVWSVKSPEKVLVREEKDAAEEEATRGRGCGSGSGRRSDEGDGLLGRNTSLEDNMSMILGSLERTARAVVDLQRRCARQSGAIDGPEATSCPQQMPPCREERVPFVPPHTPGVDSEELRRSPTPRSTAQLQRLVDEIPSQPTIAVPIPVTLPPREPTPLLEPSTPPSLDFEACSYSPEVSVRVSPTGRATLCFDSTNAATLPRVSSEENKSNTNLPRGFNPDPCFADGMDAAVIPRTVTTTRATDAPWQVAPSEREEYRFSANATPRPDDSAVDDMMYGMDFIVPDASSSRGASRGASNRSHGWFTPSNSDKKTWSACSRERDIERIGMSRTNSWLIPMFASDIVRIRREEAQIRRQEREAAAAERERTQRHEASLVVEEAMLTAAKVVAKEEFEAAKNMRTILMDKGRSEESCQTRRNPPCSEAGLLVPIDTRRETRKAAAAPLGKDIGTTFAEQDPRDPLLESELAVSPGCRQRELRGSNAALFTRDSQPEGKFADARDPLSPDRCPGGDGKRPRMTNTEIDHGDDRREGVPAEKQQRGDMDSKAAAVKRKLAPAELQAQLMNELRLHDDLQDAELRVDGLLAAHEVSKSRQEAGIAKMLLRRERATKKQEKIQLAQQTAFEAALARNDAIHEARLRYARSQAEERSARSVELAMNAVAAAAKESFACQSRQADAAVAAMAAASAHSYNQQMSAPPASMEVLMKLQETFEKALVRNDAIHEARLREAKSRADDQSARVTDVAVAAVAAAGAQAQQQRASALATQTALFNELQEAFEEALIRNNTFHEAKLRRVNSQAEERSARRTEAATASLAAAAAASFGVQRRQADAAVAAVAAAGAHAQHQQASVMAAHAAMFVELQREEKMRFGAHDRVGYNDNSAMEAARHSYLTQHRDDRGEERRTSDSRVSNPKYQARKDCGSLVEDISAANSSNILRMSPSSGAPLEGSHKSSEFNSLSALTNTKERRASESHGKDYLLNDREESQRLRESPNPIGLTQHVWPQSVCSQLGGGGGGKGKRGCRAEAKGTRVRSQLFPSLIFENIMHDKNAKIILNDQIQRVERGLGKEEEKPRLVKDHETAVTYTHPRKCPVDDDESLSQTPVNATAFLAPLTQNAYPSRPEEHLLTEEGNYHGGLRPEELTPKLIEKDDEGAERDDSVSVPQVQTADDISRSESGSDHGGMSQDAKTPLQSQSKLDAADRRREGVERNDRPSVPLTVTAEQQTRSNDGVVCRDSWTSWRSSLKLTAADEKDPEDAEKGDALTAEGQVRSNLRRGGIGVRQDGRFVSQTQSMLAPAGGNEGKTDGGDDRFSVPWTQPVKEHLEGDFEDKDVGTSPNARVSQSPSMLAANDESDRQENERHDDQPCLLLQAAEDQVESNSRGGGGVVRPGITVFSKSPFTPTAIDENDLLNAGRGGRRPASSASSAKEQTRSDDSGVRPNAPSLSHSWSVSAAGERKDRQDAGGGCEYSILWTQTAGEQLGDDVSDKDGGAPPEPGITYQSSPIIAAVDEKNGHDSRMGDGDVDARKQTGGIQTGSDSERDEGVVGNDAMACTQSPMTLTTTDDNDRQGAGRGGKRLVSRLQIARSDDGVDCSGARAYSKNLAMEVAAEEPDGQGTGGGCEYSIPWTQTADEKLGDDVDDKDGNALPEARISSQSPSILAVVDKKDEHHIETGDGNVDSSEQAGRDQEISSVKRYEGVVGNDGTTCPQSPRTLTSTETKDLQYARRGSENLVSRAQTAEGQTENGLGSDDGVDCSGARAYSKYPAMEVTAEEPDGQGTGGGCEYSILWTQTADEKLGDDVDDKDGNALPETRISSQSPSILAVVDKKDEHDTETGDGNVDLGEQAGRDQEESSFERDEGVVGNDDTTCPQSPRTLTSTETKDVQDARRGGENLVSRAQTAEGQTENGLGSDDGVDCSGARAYSKYPAMEVAAEEPDGQGTGGGCEYSILWTQTADEKLGDDVDDKDGNALPETRISSQSPSILAVVDKKDEQDTETGDGNVDSSEQAGRDQESSSVERDEGVVGNDGTTCPQSPRTLTSMGTEDLQDAGGIGNSLMMCVKTSKELAGNDAGSDDGTARPGARISSMDSAMVATTEESDGQNTRWDGNRLAPSMQTSTYQNDNDLRDDDSIVHWDDRPPWRHSSLAFTIAGDDVREEARGDDHPSVSCRHTGEERVGRDSRDHDECKPGPEDRVTPGDDVYNQTRQITDGILAELVEDTLEEYRRLFRRAHVKI